MNADNRTRYYSVDELAELLAVSCLTIRRLAATGALPASRVGRMLRFAPADVAAYLARNRSGGQADAYLKVGGKSAGSAKARQDGDMKAKRPTGKAKAKAR